MDNLKWVLGIFMYESIIFLVARSLQITTSGYNEDFNQSFSDFNFFDNAELFFKLLSFKADLPAVISLLMIAPIALIILVIVANYIRGN